MATMNWQGKATAVAQVDTVQITGFDGATTYTLTVGGQTVSVVGDTDEDTTATNLAAAWNASTHAYFTGVTATVATDTVTLTADNAGVPFIATSSVAGGGGTIGAVTSDTASAGPNDWSTAGNWSGGAVPAGADTVVFASNAVDVLWGLDQNAVTLTELRIMQSYRGKIGLPEDDFTLTATTEDTATAEYRETYLKISATTLGIGEHYGSGTPAGSGRLKINTGSNLCTLLMSNSATNTADANLEPVRWLGTHADSVIHVLKGILGIGTTIAGEAATVTELNIAHRGNVTADATVHVGDGVTLTTINQSGGVATVECAFTTLAQTAGILTTVGSGAIAGTVTVGGTFYGQSTGTIDMLVITGDGIADLSRNSQDKTITNVVAYKGATLNLDNGSGNPLSVALTNGIDLTQCGLEDVKIKAGDHYTATLSGI